MLVRADEEVAVGHGDRGVAVLAEVVGRQQLVFRAGREDEGAALLVNDVNPSGRVDRRAPGGRAAGAFLDLLLPQFLAGLPLVTSRNADVAVGVEVVAGDGGRADVHGADLVLEPALADVARAAQLDEVRAEDRQAVNEQRRGIAVHARPAGGPELLACLGIIALDLVGHREDELILFADAGDDRRAPGAQELLAGNAGVAAVFRSLPDLPAGPLVDREQELPLAGT